jgi:hypothetical protein
VYHVLNASCCSIYATAGRGQTAYAAHLRSDSTEIATYDDQIPIDAWLPGQV